MTKEDLVGMRRDAMRLIGFAILSISVIASAASIVEAQPASGWILWEKNFTTKGTTGTTT
jgi:hypothetical protein